MGNEARYYNILVIGDIVIDWMIGKLPRKEKNRETMPFDPILSVPVSGGAWFVADVLKAAFETNSRKKLRLVTYRTHKEHAIRLDSAVTQSIWNVELFLRRAGGKESEQVFRLKELKGYDKFSTNVNVNIFPYVNIFNEDLPYEVDLRNLQFDMIIIDDMNLGFRDSNRREDWEKPLARLKESGIIMMIISGIDIPKGDATPALWDFLQKQFNDRLISIVSANALRNAGAIISRRISWEATAEDFAKNVDEVPSLRQFNHLLVRFGVTGVIHLNRHNNRSYSYKLYYDQLATDGVFRDREKEGNIIGGNSIMSAWLALKASEENGGSLQGNLDNLIDQSSACMIKSFQIFYRHGYGQDSRQMRRLGTEGIYAAFKDSDCFNANNKDFKISPSIPISHPDDKKMNILLSAQSLNAADRNRTIEALRGLATNIVMHGVNHAIESSKVLAPIARFGNIIAMDRDTIESYRYFEKIIRDYFKNFDRTTPLNIAVFGAPGAGKSFSVKQIASSVDSRIEFMSCNLTQLGLDDEALTREFIRILDANRSGNMPLMMFDEFDSDDLAHLKRFLEPMESGKFPFGGSTFHLGRCILVFAGGVYPEYKQFKAKVADVKNEKMRNVKGPDFDSRLLGYIDLLGLNNPLRGDSDIGYIIRRAILLRSFVEDLGVVRREVQTNIKDSEALIDVSIVRALLEVHEFVHGARSMKAIVNACSKDGSRINRSCAPPEHYVRMHIKDPRQFFMVLNGGTVPNEPQTTEEDNDSSKL